MKHNKIKSCLIAAAIISGSAYFSGEASEGSARRFFKDPDFLKMHEEMGRARKQLTPWQKDREADLKMNAERARIARESEPGNKTMEADFLHQVGELRKFRAKCIEKFSKKKEQNLQEPGQKSQD